MSEPKNPLEPYSTYSTTFILSAWTDTQQAEDNPPPLDSGPEGSGLSGGGILILNDNFGTDTNRFIGKRLKYDYSWTGDSSSNTATIGEFTLHDVSGGDFFMFMRNEVVPKLGGISIENLSFRLDVIIHTPQEDGGDPLFRSEPIIFNVNDFNYSFTNVLNQYTLQFTSCYNTSANVSKLTRLYDMNVTHKDGQLHEEVPRPSPGGGSIVPRGAEDGIKNGPRQNRIIKSKPMTTLKDAFEALQVELNESTKIHKNQLQEWQAVIRDDFIFKLETPSVQQKELDIKFNINLDEVYDTYGIDNRTLPFEQPEGDGEAVGIRVIPSTSGEKMLNLIDRIMKYSRQVGIDAREGFTYKICPVWRKQGTTLLYDIIIKRFEVPVNFADGTNTGPGESGKNPLTFFYKVDENRDVRRICGLAHRTDKVDMVEDVIDVLPGRIAYGGEREPITGERERDIDFFKIGYSGFRAKVANNRTLAVEYPKDLAESFKKSFRMQGLQESTFIINITGNIDLMNDLIRRPSEVASVTHPKAVYYKYPEILPLYAKLKIFLETNFEEQGGPTPDLFYHTNWMHIMRVSTVIDGSHFHQTLTLARSDTLV